MVQEHLLQTYIHSHSKAREWTGQILQRIRAVRSARGSRRLDEINKLELEVMGRLYEAEHDTKPAEQINTVYADWMSGLQQQFPGLTKEDQHMCCYVKMGLSLKEIAILQGIQVDSVKEAQKRIHRKLGLEEETHLPNFIKSF